jgi:endonuclease/exonuclease/phosphatase family metal-dependent hydrolase
MIVSQETASSSCRFVSFNIRVGIETSLAHIAADLESLKPDVVALQEVGESWIMGPPLKQTAYLSSALGLPYFHFAPSLTAQPGQHFGIAFISRWPLLDLEHHLLPKDQDEQRSFVSALIHPPFSTQPWGCLTTHLSINEPERITQSQAIVDHIQTRFQDHQGPLIVLGDLNDRPHTPTLTPFTHFLTDTYAHSTASTPCIPSDESGYTFSVKEPHRRIDYLLSRAVKIHQVHVATSLKSSDHFPLLGLFESRSDDE